MTMHDILGSDNSLPVYVVEDTVVVNMTYFISKSHTWLYAPLTLHEIIVNMWKPGMGISFYFHDGENVEFSGALNLIKLIQHSLDICPSKILISSFNHISVDFATCNVLTDSPFLKLFGVSPNERYMPIQNSTFTKKFLSLSGRFDINRLKITIHLHKHWRDDSIIGYLENAERSIYNLTIPSLKTTDGFFHKEIKWLKKYAPLIVDNAATQLLEKQHLTYGFGSSSIAWYISMDEVCNYYDQYFIEVVAETDLLNANWVTEKTMRSIVLGKPFLLLGGQGALRRLRDQGFKTFSNWFNEDYDSEPNPVKRRNLILTEINRLGSKTFDDLRTMASEMQSTLKHNQAWQKSLLK